MLAGSLLLISSQAYAQASVNVPTTDLVYRDIDKLIAHDLVDIIVTGQRPYSRVQIARIVWRARQNLQDVKTRTSGARLNYVDAIIDRLEASYQAELSEIDSGADPAPRLSFRPLARVDITVTAANSPPRDAINQDFERNDAVLNPLLHYRQGRNIVDGTTASTETVHWARVSRHVAIFVQPRFQVSDARNGFPDFNEFRFQALYASAALGNLDIQVGRDNLFWGQGRNAGLLVSNNARGLDMIKISNSHLATLPWVFSLLGPTKFSVFAARLGSNRHIPNPYLLGYKVSIRPHKQLELGAGFMVQSGGTGGPPASLTERIADHVFFIDLLFLTNRDFEFSDKMAGADIRLRIPSARGLQLYAEGVIDDIRVSNLQRMLTQDAGYVVGAHMPRLVDSGRLDLTLEYHFAGILLYRHSQFESGYTLDRLFIGNDLESAGRGGYAELNWDAGARHLLTLQGAYEARSNDDYARSRELNRILKMQSNPQERRYRAVASWSYRLPWSSALLKTLVGYERVNNFGFDTGRIRDNVIGELQLQLNF